MRESKSLYSFTPGLLIPLSEAEHTDHSDSESPEGRRENQTPSPQPFSDDMVSPVTSDASAAEDRHGRSRLVEQEVTRGILSPDRTPTNDGRTSTGHVEKRGSKQLDATENGRTVSVVTNKMDDDSLGVRSAGGSSPHHQREPEGAMPRHRIGESRRFSDDLDAIIGKEMEEVRATLISNGDIGPISPTSPPEALKEISIHQVFEDVEDESDDVSAPDSQASPSTPPPAPTKVPYKQSPTTEEDSWKPMNDSLEMLTTPHRGEQNLRPPSVTDHAPQESDASVFSIHSGYAIHDANGLRIVPGTMVQSPAAFTHPYPSIPSHIHQAPLPSLQSQHSNGYGQHYHHHPYAAPPPPVIVGPPTIGKRKIHFRLMEDLAAPTRKGMRGSFLSFRRGSNRNLLTPSPMDDEPLQQIERGRVTVSWYDGTTSLELIEHVRNAVIRKVGLQGTMKLAELRILDDSSNPPEEIVLSPYIPSGSRLLIRFTTRDAGGDFTPPYGRRPSYTGGAPDSPSAAPSPHTSALDLHGLGLNSNQLALLGARLKSLQIPSGEDAGKTTSTPPKKSARILDRRRSKSDRINESSEGQEEKSKDDEGKDDPKDDQSSVFEMQSLHPEDTIQKSLQNITELLMMERQKTRYYPKQEKRQVVFTLANYFVLFLSLIAISAEIQARAPEWNAAIERHLKSVENCSKDQDALFECVSNGDFSGLVASVVLWISRSAATKRIFLFGFDSPRKLWTVVYESLVTAVCWGFSYIFIRRGMNPDTNRNFLQKYWKDAVYGSLAGFNAAFMKGVLKNLIPQEAIEDALQQRQVKILSWLPSFA